MNEWTDRPFRTACSGGGAGGAWMRRRVRRLGRPGESAREQRSPTAALPCADARGRAMRRWAPAAAPPLVGRKREGSPPSSPGSRAGLALLCRPAGRVLGSRACTTHKASKARCLYAGPGSRARTTAIENLQRHLASAASRSAVPTGRCAGGALPGTGPPTLGRVSRALAIVRLGGLGRSRARRPRWTAATCCARSAGSAWPH